MDRIFGSNFLDRIFWIVCFGSYFWIEFFGSNFWIEMLDRFVWRGVTQVRILSIQAYFHYVEELRHHFRHDMDFVSPGTHSSLHSQYYSYNTCMYICMYIHLLRPIGTRLFGGIAAMHIYICVFIGNFIYLTSAGHAGGRLD